MEWSGTLSSSHVSRNTKTQHSLAILEHVWSKRMLSIYVSSEPALPRVVVGIASWCGLAANLEMWKRDEHEKHQNTVLLGQRGAAVCTRRHLDLLSTHEPSPAQGFLLLKVSFSLPLLLGGGQALGFWKAIKHNFDHNRHHINKAEF